MMRGERGSLSAFVLCIVTAMIALAGLAYDGGRIVSRYGELSDMAGNAARIGAQQVTGIRAGEPRIDPDVARLAAARFLARRAIGGRVSVGTSTVTVTVGAIVPMRILSLFGFGSRRVSVTRTAEIVSG